MNIARILSYLSFCAVFMAYAVTGAFISTTGGIFKSYIVSHLAGRPLPQLTRIVLPYTTSGAPLYLSIISGVVVLATLIFFERSTKQRAFLPFWITLAWIPCLLHLATVMMAITLVFVLLNQQLLLPR